MILRHFIKTFHFPSERKRRLEDTGHRQMIEEPMLRVRRQARMFSTARSNV
jgi:hypothetical protein